MFHSVTSDCLDVLNEVQQMCSREFFQMIVVISTSFPTSEFESRLW